MSVAIATALLAACGAALCLRPPRPTAALLLAVAHAAVLPGALLAMLALLVPNFGWVCVATASGLVTSGALWLLRAPARPLGPDPGDGHGGWGDGGPGRPDDGGGPSDGLEIDWAAFERDALAAWRANR